MGKKQTAKAPAVASAMVPAPKAQAKLKKEKSTSKAEVKVGETYKSKYTAEIRPVPYGGYYLTILKKGDVVLTSPQRDKKASIKKLLADLQAEGHFVLTPVKEA